MRLSHLTLSELERSKSRSLRFQNITSRKGADLGRMLLCYMHQSESMYAESIGAITFDFSDPERLMSRSLRFRWFTSHKEAELDSSYNMTTAIHKYVQAQDSQNKNCI